MQLRYLLFFAITLFALKGQLAHAQTVPTTAASGIVFSAVTTSSITVTVTPGNGEKRLILMSDSPISDQPEDDFSYSLNDNIGSSTVIYSGTGNSVTVNNLDSDRTYYFTVFEFNGGSGNEKYLTIGQPSAQQNTRYYPSGGASFSNFTNVTGTSMQIAFYQGSSSGLLLVAKSGSAVDVDPADLTTYTVNPVFGTEAAHMGNGNYAVYSGTGSDVTITGLQPNTTYHFEIFEFNDFGGDKFYLTNYPTTTSQKTLHPPTIQATGIVFNSTTTNSISLSVTKGNGQKRMIAANTSAISGIPEYESTYSASATYGSGDNLNDYSSYVVYSGTDSTVVVTNLEQNTTYYFTVFEFNDDGDYPVYLTDNAPTAQQSTYNYPSSEASFNNIDQITPTSFRLNFQRGDGDSLIVFARIGSGVTSAPTDGVVYDVNSVFGTSDPIGDANYAVYSGNDNSAVITGLQPNTSYHFSAYEFNDFDGVKYYKTDYVNTTSKTTPYYPTSQGTDIVFSNIEGESMRMGLNPGNGAQRIVVARSGIAVNAVPVDGTTYTGYNDFQSGETIGNPSDGNRVVYVGSGSTMIDVNGLQPGTTYHFAVFEFNVYNDETEDIEFYLTSNSATASQSTTNFPSSQGSFSQIDNITTSSMRLNVFAGDGAHRLIVARRSEPVEFTPSNLNSYSVHQDLGTNHVVVHAGGASEINITGLDEGTTYHFAMFEFNGGAGQEFYLTNDAPNTSETTRSYPSSQGSNIVFSEITNSTMRLTLNKGTGDKRIIVARSGFAVNSVPTDGRDYTASTWFSNGDSLGTDDNYAIYAGIDSTVVIDGLQPNTTYHFAVFEFNDFGEETVDAFYLTTNPPTASQITTNVPVNPSALNGFEEITKSSMRLLLGETTDDGENRIIVIRSGTAVTFTPQKNSTYSLNQDLGDGQYVAYVGNAYSVDLTGLADSTTYHVAVFEFNGGAGEEEYLIAGAQTASQQTRYSPSSQGHTLTFSEIANTSMRLTLHPGSGGKRLILIKSGSAVDDEPVDGTTYSQGDELSEGNIVAYAGADTTVVISGLTANSTYHVAVFEYNDFGNNDGNEFYLTSNPPTANQTTTNFATVAASNIAITNITSSSLTLSFDAGDGEQRVILARSGSAVNVEPQNGETYTMNSDLGDGNIVMYVGNASSVNITGLDHRTTYHFAVYEFSVIGGEETYLLTTPARGSALTTSLIPNANLRLLLSADRGTSQDAGKLVSWSDQSGNALSDATAPSEVTRPTLVPNVINGKSVIRFQGGQYLNLPTASSIDIADKASDIFIVYRSTALFDQGNDIQFLIAGDLGRNELHTNGAGGGGLRFIPNNVGAPNNNTTDGQYLDVGTTGDFTNTEPQLIRLQSSDTYGEITVNGKTTLSHPKNSQSSFTGTLRMGLRADGSYPLEGDIAEIIFYNEILGTTARDSVYSYLSAKYGLTLPPTLSASNVSFTELTPTSVNLSVTPGNGDGRVIVAKKGSAVDFEPVDGTTYTGNASMGTGNHVVYAGTGSNVTITGLDERTTYHFAIFEYNGEAGEEVYRRIDSASDSVRTRSPIPYTNMQLMLSADYGAIIESGGVSTWADQSGNDRSVTQDASGHRPTVVDDVLNGEPVVRFNGSSSYLILPSTSDLGIVDNDYQVFIVARSSASTSSTYNLMATTNKFDHFEIQMNSNSGGTAFLANATTVVTEGATGAFTDGEPHLFEVEATSSYGLVRMNGSETSQVNQDSQSDELTNLVLGTRSGGTFWFAGDIAEVILYNRVLTSNERDSVQTYLFGKYAIQNYRDESAQLTGTEGWRLLSTPVADSSYASFFRGLWTQGFTGASVSHGTPNVYTWPIDGAGRDASSWAPLADAAATLHPGSAVLAYIYSDDDGPGNENNAGFPKTLRSDGFALRGDVNLDANLNPNVGGWSLIGNPFITNVDWDGFTKGNLSNAVYLWDNAASEWKSWNGSVGGLSDGLIGPFNGFFVETLVESPTLSVPASAKAEGNSVFLGKEETNPVATIELSVNNASGLRNSSWIQFTADALNGKDRMDAIKLVPLSLNYVQVASFSPEYGKLLDINHLPSDFDIVEIPVDVASTYSEVHQLVFDSDLLPDDWTVTLRDNRTGTRYSGGDVVTFTPERRAKRAAVGADITPVIEAQSSHDPRFTLIVERGESTEVDPQTPGDVSLAQNFPNPFNPTTVIGFNVGTQDLASIRLAVYDLLGREIAVLVDGPMSAGAHTVSFDASGLSSGVYIYRLQTAQGVLSRKMLLIK